MTYRLIVYLILDEIKLISGDSIINEDHIVFLADKYRPFLLKLYYDLQLEKEIADNVYQEICLDLTNTEPVDGDYCGEGLYVKSVQKIPKLANFGNVQVTPMDFYQGIRIAFISRNRMRYVGENKWMRNIIYCSLGGDLHLYFKSSNPLFLNLEKVKMTAIFQDSADAAELSCECLEDGESCDPLDKEFPFEDHLYPLLVELILKEVLGAAYRPADTVNNDSDDLSDLYSFIRLNSKSNLAKLLG